MMPSDDKKRSGARSKTLVQGSFGDPWADWRPEWPMLEPRRNRPKPAAMTGAISVHAQQEKIAPTMPVVLRGAASGSAARRRIVDARLWDAMTGAQQDAALQIAEAFEAMSRGLGYVTSDWQRLPGAAGSSNAGAVHSRLIHGYVEWTKNCHREKISHAMIVDILAFGLSCRQQDRDRRLRAGSARRNLMDGLTLYCLLQGWPTVR
ncbi:MAG: hypothetical protein Q8K65_04040 [Alphaproteobacteria bacterium]|nr:hypothetical protein [Alphaproteobacteria bacterium]